MARLEDTLTLPETTKIPQTLNWVESVAKALNTEEIQTYSKLISQMLRENNGLSIKIKLLALSVLKTFSHLSKDQSLLVEQAKNIPLSGNREIYYQVPFLPELTIAPDQLFQWYQKEAKWVLTIKRDRGEYSALKLMIYLYEAMLFQMSTHKQLQKQYLTIAGNIFKTIRENMESMETAFQNKDTTHPWFSPESAGDYKRVAMLWKETLDVTTVRHGQKIPSAMRQATGKMPFDWVELLKINHANKVTILNIVYPLNGLESQCREIRTYSSYLLHLVSQDRPEFLPSLTHTRVAQSFMNRLKIAWQLKQNWPQLPQDLQESDLREVLMVLMEQAINSLATQHKVKIKAQNKLAEKFNDFGEQVQTRKEIVLVGTEMEIEEVSRPEPALPAQNPEKVVMESSLLEKTEAPAIVASTKSDEPKALEKEPLLEAEAQQQDDVPPIATDFEPITDEMEFGMGIQTMPYVFPFDYSNLKEEVPLQYFPDIKWDQLKWSDMRAGETHVFNGVTRVFIKKLETIETYRYDIYAPEEFELIKPAPNYYCFIVKQAVEDRLFYYVAIKKAGLVPGKNIAWVQIKLSERFMAHIDKAYFMIFPKPYNQHIFVIPR
ncbi:MAG: hypothetical protein HQM12_05915 [SAR324 cluster bacterium]|nr:hypothetical protein [SAR324 cluster bacterium]